MTVAIPDSPDARADRDVTTTTMTTDARAPRDPRLLRLFVIGWIAAGVMLLLLLGRPDVVRTQEARVLGTAREMLERGTARDWIVPHLNDKPRLQKPPLAYWASAVSFAVLGVNDFSGRLPAALSAWLTVGATFLIARRQFGDRAALFAAAALFGSVLFLRYGALAETDVWVALFHTVAIGAMWRCFDDDGVSRRRFALWAHASAAAVGLILLVKGAPALFPLLFLFGAAAVRRRWDVPRRWLMAGAPVTVLLIGATWYIYIANIPEARILLRELRVLAGGGGHRALFVMYFRDLLLGSAPWTGVMLLGVASAVRHAWRGRRGRDGGADRGDTRITLALLWFAVVFVPLCISSQKQKHYLMPALPPLAIMTGWVIDRALRRARGERDPEAEAATGGEPETDPFVRAAKPMLVLTLCAAAVAVGCVPILGYLMRGRVSPLHDLSLGAAISAAGAAGLWMMRRHGLAAGAAALAMIGFPAILLTLLCWMPTTYVNTYREVAAAMRRDERDAGGVRPRYGFYAQPENLPICWAARRVIPSFFTQADVDAALASQPRPVLLSAWTRPSPPMPPGYYERHRFVVDDRQIVIYAPKQYFPVAGTLKLTDGRGI